MSFLVKSEAMPNTVPGMMPGMPQPHVQYAAMPSGAFGVDKLHCCGIEITFLGFAYQVDVGQGCWYPETFADNFRYQTSSHCLTATQMISHPWMTNPSPPCDNRWQAPWQVGKFHGCNGEDDPTWLFAVLSMDPNDWIWNEAVPAVCWFDLSTLHHCAVFHCSLIFFVARLTTIGWFASYAFHLLGYVCRLLSFHIHAQNKAYVKCSGKWTQM